MDATHARPNLIFVWMLRHITRWCNPISIFIPISRISTWNTNYVYFVLLLFVVLEKKICVCMLKLSLFYKLNVHGVSRAKSSFALTACMYTHTHTNKKQHVQCALLFSMLIWCVTVSSFTFYVYNNILFFISTTFFCILIFLFLHFCSYPFVVAGPFSTRWFFKQ